MELRQLKYFTCLYEEGSVTKAAQRLNIVQPALSMQISKLEEELGRQPGHGRPGPRLRRTRRAGGTH
jgi:hypothetical protein